MGMLYSVAYERDNTESWVLGAELHPLEEQQVLLTATYLSSPAFTAFCLELT